MLSGSVLSRDVLGGGPIDPDRDRTPATSVVFMRRVPTPFETGLRRFERWWRLASWRGDVELGGSRLLGPPRAAVDGEWCVVDIVLDRGSMHPAVPMQLHVGRWSASLGTALELVPQRRLHAGHRYFQEGHLVLDRLEAVING